MNDQPKLNRVWFGVFYVMCWGGGFSSHLSHAKSAEPPKLYDTLRVLKHPRGVDQALNYLTSLSSAELKMIKIKRLQVALSTLACPENAQLDDADAQQTTARALKALSLIERIRELDAGGECLRAQWMRTAQVTRPQNTYGQAYPDLIARRASAVLSRLSRVDLLSGATSHPDPVVRKHAARAGADANELCTLAQDRWPEVKLAAIRGLERLAGPESACLVNFMSASLISIRLSALRGLGRLAAQPWASTHSEISTLIKARLKSHFEQSSIKPHERGAILTTLALWGETSEAQQVLTQHLRNGSLEALSGGALYALLLAQPRSQQRLELLRDLLRKQISLSLRLAIARALLDHRLGWDTQTDPMRAEFIKSEPKTQRIPQDSESAALTLRVTLIQRVIEQLPLRGNSRLVRDLQFAYADLYRRDHPELKPKSDEYPDLAPPLDKEND